MKATELTALKGPFKFFQLAYVTNDLEQAAETLGAVHGVARFAIQRDGSIQTSAGIAHAHFALAFVGTQQLEIIQPAGGADAIYGEILPRTGFSLRMHHLGGLVTDAGEWQRAHAALRASSYDTPIDGIYEKQGVPLMHYLYADTRALLGHYLEFMYQTDAGRGLFEHVPRY